jgi:flagellar hook assembly protein FlgD
LTTVPNPFNPQTEIRFTVHRPGAGALRIYTAQGRLVRTLHAGSFTDGAYAFTWDGRGDGGERMASGVYLARLEIAGQVGVQKLTLVK